MKILSCKDFEAYWKSQKVLGDNLEVTKTVLSIIDDVRQNGDAALHRLCAQFEKCSPAFFEVPLQKASIAWEKLKSTDPNLALALELSADHIRCFAQLQKDQIKDFEIEIERGIFTSQRVIPVERAAIYVPAGNFPLISTVLMGVIPSVTAGTTETIVVSPPQENGLPDERIMAAAYLAGAQRIFALGGAQAIAAFALGSETVPRCDVIAGPGNKYVAAAKKLLYGEVGIDFIAGPTDVLVITDESSNLKTAALDLIAQAEHDIASRARILVPHKEAAEVIIKETESQLARLKDASTARRSLEDGGLIVIYDSITDAIACANTIAPEHLELHVASSSQWIDGLKNYGSLFIGSEAAEVLGDYSAGINHTLPTSGSARFSGGLSVRHFLKVVTHLRCENGAAYKQALDAAAVIAAAEGLDGHANAAKNRPRALAISA
ncbi:MAG: histidinol dehydrogenase [Termitinemataceae bacterium]|nr:MAG: histidinol dehydrogenase [Termitinemataceae bacterium]